mmetsp:Transcript_26592/g.40813  ORF Transcript_26592/g.40813 Transcript_26592/m.40813 type:complete len:85 (-) Transcript_26592:56-310(-)
MFVQTQHSEKITHTQEPFFTYTLYHHQSSQQMIPFYSMNTRERERVCMCVREIDRERRSSCLYVIQFARLVVSSSIQEDVPVDE